MKYIFIALAFSLTFLNGVSVTTTTTTDKSKLSTSSKKHYFGEELFKGNFIGKSKLNQDSSYILKIGDIVTVNLWGAYEFNGSLAIDGEGNIFIPKVGTISLKGVTKGQLKSVIETQVKSIFKTSVFVYASIEFNQAISVFVTGAVNKIGLYQGSSTDSILQYIDNAGGIISGEGSYRNISILRNNKRVKSIDLYSFLLNGHIDSFRFKKGDVILVHPIKSFIEIDGDVSRPYFFELKYKNSTVKNILKFVLPKYGVNRFTHTKLKGSKEVSQTYKISKASYIRVSRGEKLTFSSNHYIESVNIEVEGEHKSIHHFSLPKGTSLYTLLSKIEFSPFSDITNIQIYRKSVAQTQKNLLETRLKDLKAKALSNSSATSEEASIRAKESEMIMKFIEEAKKVEFKGKVLLSKREDLRYTLLEDGDKIYIPKKSNIVIVHGEVEIPNALTYRRENSVKNYIEACGGFNERAQKDKILLIKGNGRIKYYDGTTLFSFFQPKVEAGDSILVLSKTDTKNIILAKDITQILYQIAVGAGVALRL